MFKRIQKLSARRAADEELGLDEELRAELGLGMGGMDDDSSGSEMSEGDESDNEDESDEEDEEEEESDREDDDGEDGKEDGEGATKAGSKRKRLEGEHGEDAEGSELEDGDEDEGSDSEDEDEEEDDDKPPMSVQAALYAPVYTQRGAPVKNGFEARTCILCPLKELKNEKAVEVHLGSVVSFGASSDDALAIGG